jgi:long-chain acyl-CoA synthetase
LKYILKDAEVKIIFVADRNIYQKINAIKPELPLLEAIYTFDEFTLTILTLIDNRTGNRF